jgi:hypothetical protein
MKFALRASEMLLRNVKCAAARGGNFHFTSSESEIFYIGASRYFTWRLCRHISHFAQAKYFTKKPHQKGGFLIYVVTFGW